MGVEATWYIGAFLDDPPSLAHANGYRRDALQHSIWELELSIRWNGIEAEYAKLIID